MYEVKVFDSSGNLKKVISVNQLITRDEIKYETPSVFQKNKRHRGPSVKFCKSVANQA